MNHASTVWPPHAFRFGGGGNSGSAAAPSVAATPVPASSPPVTASAAEVIQAQQDMRRQALKKRGFSSTIRAGDTGGWLAQNSTPSPMNPHVGGNAAAGAPKLGG